MHLTVALAPRNPVALNAYARAVSDPASSNYRRYLTPVQFRARFAPARRAVVKVETSLRRHGLRPGHVSANGLSIGIRASGAAIERAFRLTLARVRLATGRDAIYNAQAPAVDAGVARSVQAVIGLSSVARMQRLDLPGEAGSSAASTGARSLPTSLSAAHVATGGPRPCIQAALIAPGQGAYTADQIANAYGFSGLYRSGDLGQGVTIAVYELEPNAPSDIAAYQRCYRTDASVSYVKVDGGAGTGTGEGEAALDIEQLIGLAPKAKLLVYQGPNNNSDNPGTGPYDTLAAIVSQDKAQVISNSWGECESLEGATDAHAENTLLEEAATQGQTLRLSAAGDSGSEDCYSPPPGGNMNNSLPVDDPGSQPFATSVGGTSMTSIGPPPIETVWNDDDPNVDYSRFGIEQGAGGGGISSLWAMPGYQSTARLDARRDQPRFLGRALRGGRGQLLPRGSRRLRGCRPDVPPTSTTGTATATPRAASRAGRAPAAPAVRRRCGRRCSRWPTRAAPVAARSSGSPNPELYQLAGQASVDVLQRHHDRQQRLHADGNTSGLYPATVGYDMASGLGTPKAAALVPALCRQAVHIGYPGAVHTFYQQSVHVPLTATLASGQSGPIEFHASGLPEGLHLDRNTGVISRAGRAARCA